LRRHRSGPERRAGSPTDQRLSVTGAVAAAATLAFYAAVVFPLSGTYVGELFGARGWVPYVICFLSFWAAVVLLLKYRLVLRQREALDLDLLPERIGARISPDNAAAFTAHLDELPASVAGNALVLRIRRALHHFEARRDAREVVDQLASQAQADADAVESSYTMVRVFIWAVPILGFIGTVIGIGAAVGGFSESVGAAVDLDVMKNSIGSVTTGLAVAFDTTLLALVMSILIMFPASSLQKSEEDFLAAVEDYCDERLVRRLDDAGRGATADASSIERAIAHEMAAHHVELRGWLDRLGQIGETLTAHVVSGWEKIDEQLRVRQDQQMERLARWASERQREASDELAETQRGLLRDFRSSLEGMAAEARRIQEEGAHRLDDQLAGIERLHRRVGEEQQAAADVHRAQVKTLTSAGDQLAHTLARLRGEAAEVREESGRQLAALAAELAEITRAAHALQHSLLESQEEQARLLRESAARLAGTLEGVDAQLRAAQDDLTARRDVQAAELAGLERERELSRRQASELHEAQLASLHAASDELTRSFEGLRGEARAAGVQLAQSLGDLEPALAERLEEIATELTAPWRRQLAELERSAAQRDAADDAAATPRTRFGRLFRRS
jgi:biopolymer transport protein ExbB/TolQ